MYLLKRAVIPARRSRRCSEGRRYRYLRARGGGAVVQCVRVTLDTDTSVSVPPAHAKCFITLAQFNCFRFDRIRLTKSGAASVVSVFFQSMVVDLRLLFKRVTLLWSLLPATLRWKRPIRLEHLASEGSAFRSSSVQVRVKSNKILRCSEN